MHIQSYILVEVSGFHLSFYICIFIYLYIYFVFVTEIVRNDH